MDLSSLLHRTPLLPSLRLQPPVRRRQVTLRRCSTSPSASNSSIFAPSRELTGVQPLINGMAPPVRIASSVAIALAAIAAGYGLGFKIAGTKNAAIAGGAALGVAGCGLVYKMNSEVSDVAAINLHNLVMGHDDPLELKLEEVDAVAKKYGVSKQDNAFKTELCDLYYRFVYDVLPPGGEDLKGNEVETILKFKSALGIDDPDAANVHMEIGRRIFRERLETGDRDSDAAQRLAFQKLIYVSNLVFGEASAFLLPWKRLFKVTDAQVNIAIRDNAKKLYSLKLNTIGKDIEPNQLIELRKFQLYYQLSDDIASEMFSDHARKLIEENIKSALDILKFRSKSLTQMPEAIELLENIISFNDLLTSLSHHPDFSQFAPGVGPVSLIDGQYYSSELKLLYNAYVSESFPNGRLDVKKIDGFSKLRDILGLGKKEAESIILDIKSTIYKRRLSKTFNTDLALAPSKASFLQNLCEELHFDPENASKLHEEIYSTKLQQLVGDNELTDDDVATLTSYQVRLCIPQETVDKIHNEICGKLFTKVVENAVSSDSKGFDSNIQAAVRKAAHGLRLSKDEAMSIASKAVRKALSVYIRRAKDASNKTEAARELQNMISFNASVVTPLISDIKGEPVGEETKPDPESDEEDEEMLSLKDLKPNENMGAVAMQKEVNLKDDLAYFEKADFYETFLNNCTTSTDEVKTPFGLHVSTEVNKTEYNKLDQLGEILGLTEAEMNRIRINITEKTFIKEAEVILSDGQLTKARIEQLSRLQRDLKLPDENAQKVIKNITRNKMASSIEFAVSRGTMGLKEIRGLKSSGVIISDVMTESLREVILKKAVEELFGSGKGEFDETEVYQKIPEDLAVDEEKARKVVAEVAKGRIKSALVQAVAQFRQKNPTGVVGSLNDMLACDMAVPAEAALTWAKPAELDELYRIYLKSIPKPEKLSRLQFLLGLSDEKASEIQDAAQEGALPIVNVEADDGDGEEEEEFVF